MIITSYRSHEIDSLSSVGSALDNLKKQNLISGNISLGSLAVTDVANLLKDTLRQNTESVYPLAQLCYEKTGGNPFFLINLLQNLAKNDLIKFDHITSQWKWDLERIKQMSISENVLHLMTERVNKLPVTTQRVLQIAACLGNPFNIELLSDVFQILFPLEDTNVRGTLIPALADGLIFSYGNTTQITHYQFAHDRIQQAVYSLINEDRQKFIHINVARYLLKKIKDNNINDMIFDIVDHYNLVIQPTVLYVVDVMEKRKIVELNLLAAKIAKSSAAFESALGYIESALKCVDKDSWQSDYQLMLDLYTEAVDNSFLIRKYNEMEKYSQIGLANAKTILDEINIIKIKVMAMASQNKQHESVEIAIDTISRLGIKISKTSNKLDVFISLLKVKFLLKKIGISNICNLPIMTDPVKKAIVNMITICYPCAYQSYHNLFPILVCTNVMLSLQYGNTEGSAYSYCVYGIMLIGVFGEIDRGYEFGNIGMKLMETIHDDTGKTKITFAHFGGIKIWKDSVYLCMPKLVENFETGLGYGDLEYSLYSIHIYISQAFHAGTPLRDLLTKISDYKNRVQKIKHRSIYNYISIFHQSAANLAEINSSPDILIGEFYDEDKMFPICIEAHDYPALFSTYFNKVLLAFMFGKYKEALEYIKVCDKYISIVYSLFGVPSFHFYKCLTLLAIYETRGMIEKKHIIKSVHLSQQKLKKWAKSAPSNHLQKYLLIEAELMRIKKNKEKASILYDQAIAAAKENQFFNEEAVANELAAKFYLNQGSIKIATLYIEDAYQCFQKWGAKAKLAQLESLYEKLLSEKINANLFLPMRDLSLSISVSDSSTYTSKILDLATIQKTVSIIASTIVLEDLLRALMHIIIVNAGAQKCALLLEKDGVFSIEAESSVELKSERILQSITIDDSIIPKSLINYVIRTKETVVLENATHLGEFVNNLYILKNQIKSVLCMPLFTQGALTGVLYLENTLTKSAFTANRIELLNLLSSQISISINNAKAYANIMELNKKLLQLNKSYERFLPHEFLNLLEKNTINDIKLGTQVQKNMTVLFSDIRNFTRRSEKMTPDENFLFINTILNILGPLIRKYNGFIDKYIGDAVMALFPDSADDAITCAIEMQKILNQFNINQSESVKIGIGINTGPGILGIIGEEHRMNATVISRTVNIASRIESLTKELDATILITESTYAKIKNPAKFTTKFIDKTMLKGIDQAIAVYAVYGLVE